MDKNFCVGFMQNAVDGAEATHEDRTNFINSLRAAHSEGFYLAHGTNKGWKLSNKNPEKLSSQIKDFDHLIKSLFEWTPDLEDKQNE